MIQLCLVLVTVGLLLLVAEIFMSGFGVCGFLGLALMVVAAVLAVVYVPYGWLVVLAEVGLLATYFGIAVHYVRRRQLSGALIMNENLHDPVPPVGDLQSFIGREGTTVTVLRPFGAVDFNGLTLEVSSDGQYVERGVKVKVKDLRVNTLIVSAQ